MKRKPGYLIKDACCKWQGMNHCEACMKWGCSDLVYSVLKCFLGIRSIAIPTDLIISLVAGWSLVILSGFFFFFLRKRKNQLCSGCFFESVCTVHGMCLEGMEDYPFDSCSMIIVQSWASTLCADSLSVRFTPMLPQWHVKDPGHSAKSAGDRLLLNTLTPLTHQSRSGLTVPLSRQSMGIYQEMSSHAARQGTLG